MASDTLHSTCPVETLEQMSVVWLRSLGYQIMKPSVAAVPQTTPQPAKPKPIVGGPDGFDDFWSAYPRKENKAAARKAWATAVKRESIGFINEKLKAQVLAGMFSTETKFIPLASTWLNQERWDNAIRQAKQAPVKASRSALDAFLDED